MKTQSALVTLTLQSFNGACGSGTPGSEKIMEFDVKVLPVGVTDDGEWTDIRAVGQRLKRGESGESTTVDLQWTSWQLGGTGSGSGASNLGYNIYRRAYNEDWDFSSPLNGTLLLPPTSSINYQDVTAKPNTVYYYRVYGVDSNFRIETYAGSSPAREVRVAVPDVNKALVHRWMVNKEICEGLGLFGDASNNFRCPYIGPGNTILDTVGVGTYDSSDETYYDLGHDLIVDRYEAGCPFSDAAEAAGNCGPYGCIGVDNPKNLPANEANPADGLTFYDRSSGKCFRAENNAWESYNLTAWNNTSRKPKLDSFKPDLPPISHMDQSNAYEYCNSRDPLRVKGVHNKEGSTGNSRSVIPTRKEQIAMSQWSKLLKAAPPATVTALETGLNLSSGTSECNSLDAGTLKDTYSDDIYPTSGLYYSLPGTKSSNIRSVVTGSELTASCQSRYGIQDLVGNMNEWASDQWDCSVTSQASGPDISACEGIIAGVDPKNDHLSVNDPDHNKYNFGIIIPVSGGAIPLFGPCDADDVNDCNPSINGFFTGAPIVSSNFNASQIYSTVGLPVTDAARSAWVSAGNQLDNYVSSVGSFPLYDDYWHLNLFVNDGPGNRIDAGKGDTASLLYGGGWDSSKPLAGTRNGVWSMELKQRIHRDSSIGLRCMNRIGHAVCNYSSPGTTGCSDARGCVGESTPSFSSDQGSLFYDEAADICYHYDGNNWEGLHTACPIDSRDSAVCGGDCVSSQAPSGSPSVNGVHYYDSAARRCYVSANNAWKEISF